MACSGAALLFLLITLGDNNEGAEKIPVLSAVLGPVLQSEVELQTSRRTDGRKPSRGKVEAEANKKCKRENKKCRRMCIVF
jgi:hypothetical protein